MIAYLKGILFDKQANEVIVDVNGVGYQVGISTITYERLPDKGQPIQLRIYHHFTESDQRLFGFINPEEKELFELLITVKNIGPRLALNILSGIDASQLVSIIASQDAHRLSQIPGIGKKTAERLLLELRDKIESVSITTGNGDQLHFGLSRDSTHEAAVALQSLGYKKQDAEETIRKILRSNDQLRDTAALIREALKTLNR
ncbi:MAG TPA: Holliday junction branch migration protein RuvA [Balneolales bacterium]|nr:Holliday junction branch migration protein RuvA [Balneolales bacterium]